MRIRHLTTLVAIVLAVAMAGLTVGCAPEEEPPPPTDNGVPDETPDDPPDDPLLPGDINDGDDQPEVPW